MDEEKLPSVWVSRKQFRLVSGGNAPDASFIEFQDSDEYAPASLLREAEERYKKEHYDRTRHWKRVLELEEKISVLEQEVAGGSWAFVKQIEELQENNRVLREALERIIAIGFATGNGVTMHQIAEEALAPASTDCSLSNEQNQEPLERGCE